MQPVAAIAPEMALAGHPVVEINSAETPLSNIAQVSVRANAIDVLPALVDMLTSDMMRAEQEEALHNSLSA